MCDKLKAKSEIRNSG